MNLRIISKRLLLLSVIFTEKINTTRLPHTSDQQDIFRLPNLLFDARSLQQVTAGDTDTTPDYWAIFDDDETTGYTFDAKTQDQISFQLLDTKVDQNFASVFYEVIDVKNPEIDVRNDFTISVIDKNGLDNPCKDQSYGTGENRRFIACQQNGIQLLFKHNGQAKSNISYLFKEIIVWPHHSQKYPASDDQTFHRCSSIECKLKRQQRSLATCPNPCTITSIGILLDATLTPLVAQSFDLTNTNKWSLQLAVDQTTTCCKNADKWAITVTSVDNPTSVTEFDKIDPSGTIKTGTFKDYLSVGNYVISVTQVHISGVWYSTEIMNTLTSPNSFQLTVLGPCSSATVTPSSIKNLVLKVFDPIANYNTFTNFNYVTPTNNKINQSPDCGDFTYTASIVQTTAQSGLSVFNLDQVAQNFQIFSASLSQVGTFTVVLTGALVKYPTSNGQTTFTLTVLNPCWQTILSASSILNTMSTYVLSSFASVQQAPQFNNLVDSSQNKVLEICGNVSYLISDSANIGFSQLTGQELAVNTSGMISLMTNNFAAVGTHTATLTTYLTQYPNITLSQTVQIIIQPCQVQRVIISSPFTQTYTIASPTLSWTVNPNIFTQQPACGYAVTLSVDPTTVPSFVTVINGPTLQFQLYSRDISFASQSYSVLIHPNLVGYPYSAPQSEIASQTLLINDPCQLSKITGPTKIQDFVTFGGYNSTSDTIYEFNDTVSQQLTLLTDSQDFCGPKNFYFKINSTETTLLTGSNMQNIIFAPKLNTSTFGSQLVTLKVFLKNYQSVQSIINFNVVTLGSKAPTILNQHYQIGQEALTIIYDQFEIIPSSYNSANQTSHTFSLYLLGDNTDIASVSLNSSTLTPIQNHSWIHFNSSSNSIHVFSTNNDLVGNYTLAVVQTFDYFPNIRQYVQFQLTISHSLIVDLTPLKTQDTLLYVIGAVNKPVSLLQYYNLSLSSQFMLDFNVTQISDTSIAPEKLYVDENYNLIIKVQNRTLAYKQLQFQILVTTNLINQKSNNDLVLNVLFQVNSSETEQSALSLQEIQIQQKRDFLFQGVKRPISQPNQKSEAQPAKIVSISQLGLVTIQFSRQLYLPQFQQYQNNSTSSENKRSLNISYGMKLEEFINESTLDVKLRSKQGVKNVDWVCQSFTAYQLKIQIKFKSPLEVSSYFTDKIEVRFMQSDLFVLSTLTDYLFTNDIEKILTAQVPPQFPSEQNHALFTSVAQSATKAAPVIIVISLVLQIIAKKVITSMFIYYSTLQIILFVTLQTNTNLPASVNLFFETVYGIISLSSFDKKAIGEKLNLPESVEGQNSLFLKLGGVALFIFVILLIIVVAAILYKFNKIQKVKEVIKKVIEFFFWNFLIRYFQVSLINFNYAALVSIQNPDSLSDKIISSNILTVLYSLIAIICYILVKRQAIYLDLESTKKSIGNLYLNLNTTYRFKIFYGAMFYIQRLLIVLVVSLKIDFGLQWIFIQLVVLTNSIYLFGVKPYNEWADARVDYFNTLLLLVSLVLFASVSPWVSDPTARYQNGIYFDCLVGCGLLLNLIYIAYISIRPLKLKVMRYLYQKDLKEQKRQKQIEKEQKAAKEVQNSQNPQGDKIQQIANQKNQTVQRTPNEPEESQVNQLVTLSKEMLDELNSKTKAFNIVGKFLKGQKLGKYQPPQVLSKDNNEQMSIKMKNFNTMYKYMSDQKAKWLVKRQKQQIGPQIQLPPVVVQVTTPLKLPKPEPIRSQQPKFAINYNLHQVKKPFQRFDLHHSLQQTQLTSAKAQLSHLILQQSLRKQQEEFNIENQLFQNQERNPNLEPRPHHANNFSLNPHAYFEYDQ